MIVQKTLGAFTYILVVYMSLSWVDQTMLRLSQLRPNEPKQSRILTLTHINSFLFQWQASYAVIYHWYTTWYYQIQFYHQIPSIYLRNSEFNVLSVSDFFKHRKLME